MDLNDVTLVGNDSGGAISQFVIDTDASRIGRLVLTNCDAFENFPPAPFDTLFKSFRRAGAIRALMAPMRATAVAPLARRLRDAGPRVRRRPDARLGRAVPERRRRPPRHRGVRREADPGELLDVATRLGTFEGPVLLVWGNGDRFFKVDFARRLRDVFADARLVEIEGGLTFVPIEHPERLAQEIGAFSPVTAA